MIELIAERVGLQLNEHRQRILASVIDKILATGRFANISMLSAWLYNHDEDDVIWQQIVQALTVGETYFYRNQAHMKALQEDVLPALINRRRQTGQRYLRIWSAGCATGEEPYSLAMMLHDVLPDLAFWDITLLATDLNEEYLDRARAGVYRAHSFRGETPDWVQGRWFKTNGGAFELKPSVRDMVQFNPLNLLDDQYPAAHNDTSNMDLIVCRNVTIYFDRPTTSRIIDRFHKALVPDGWLVVGHSEPQPGVYDAFETCNFENAIFYRKTAKASKPLPPEPIYIAPEPPARVFVPPVVKAAPVAKTTADPMELWLKARAAADAEYWDEAFRLLEQADQHDVLQPQVHYLRGLIHMQMGNMVDARAALRQAVYCDANFALAHYSLGDLYAAAGDGNEAKRSWQRAQKVMRGLPPETLLPFGDDLTVDMLNAIVEYRLKRS